MKLYTEDQVREAFDNGYKYASTLRPTALEEHYKYVENSIKSLTPIELPSDEEIISRFMNWFLKHYSTATIDGFFGYVNSLEEEVSINEILDDYFNQNK